jgi:hypothetical protein
MWAVASRRFSRFSGGAPRGRACSGPWPRSTGLGLSVRARALPSEHGVGIQKKGLIDIGKKTQNRYWKKDADVQGHLFYQLN